MLEFSTKRIGDRGEELAREYLGRHGFTILAANFRYRRKEIDLIASGEGFIVFVEVKLRRGTGFGRPAEAVDGRKQAAILACARAFLHAHRCDNRACRFDVVSIELGESGEPAIEHIRNAFSSDRP